MELENKLELDFNTTRCTIVWEVTEAQFSYQVKDRNDTISVRSEKVENEKQNWYTGTVEIFCTVFYLGEVKGNFF